MKHKNVFLATVMIALITTTACAQSYYGYVSSGGDNPNGRIYYNIEGAKALIRRPAEGNYGSYMPSGNITIPSSITYQGYAYPVQIILYNAFKDCNSITSVVIPSSIYEIYDGAFSNCTGLTNITINGHVTMHEYIFSGCSNLTSVSLGQTYVIGAGAFAGCSSIQHINIPSTVTSINNYAFSGCESLKSITIPNSVTKIGAYAFTHCTNLETVTLGRGLESLGQFAFGYCPILKQVTFNADSCSSGMMPFSGVYDSLSLFIIGETVKRIPDYFCQGISNPVVETIRLNCATPPDVFSHSFLYYNATLIVPCGEEDSYRSHAIWGRFSNITSDCDGIDDVETTNFRVYTKNGCIVVEGANNKNVQVFDIMGKPMGLETLPNGIYIVKIGNHSSYKVAVMR